MLSNTLKSSDKVTLPLTAVEKDYLVVCFQSVVLSGLDAGAEPRSGGWATR